VTLRSVTSLELIKVERGNIVADSHSVLIRWRNHFSQLLNVHGVNDIRHTEIHTGEPPVPKPSALEVNDLKS
jgi:hypothetical protein